MSVNQDNLVKLSVGGTPYTVSLELINRFPDSKLAKTVSECKEGGHSIFIEGNGKRFEYVKDYIRNDFVELPPGESKANLTKELTYFGIKFDPLKIVATEINLTASHDQHQRRIITAHQNKTISDRRNYICDLVATDIQKAARKLKVDYDNEGKTLYEFEYIFFQYSIVHRFFNEMKILDDEVKKDFINYINALEILKDLGFIVTDVVEGGSDSSEFAIQVESMQKSKKRPGEEHDDNPKAKVRESEETYDPSRAEFRREIRNRKRSRK